MGDVPPYGYDLRYQSAEGKFLFVLRHMPDGTKRILNQKKSVTHSLGRDENLSVSKRDRAKLIRSEEARVKVIKKIFEMYVREGKGYKAVADTLNTKGIPTARKPA